MSFHSVASFLQLSLSLGLSAMIAVPYASAEANQPTRPLSHQPTAQFAPTDNETLNDETIVSTTGGRYFQPPADTRSLGGAQTTTGTRSGGSCAAATDSALAFSSLGPRSMSGLTVSARPEFVWYMTDAEAESPVLFRLLSVDENDQATVVTSAELSATAGFMSYQLPETEPSLEVGENYLWQVIVKCDSGGGSSSRFLASTLSITLVEPTAELTTALSAATNDQEKAVIYGQAGVWYDAFAMVSAGTTTAEAEVRTGLLQDLAMIEDEDETFSATLSAIAEQTASERMSQLPPQ